VGKKLGCFTGIAKQIAGFGYGVYAIDHPGFGLSDGLHGHIPSFDDLADNAIEQFTKMKGISKLYLLLLFGVESCFWVLFKWFDS
jgi:alpha-beta hydrolase superfamily lysophospholipase